MEAFRIIIFIFTILIVLAMIGLGIYGFMIPHIGLGIICLVLAVAFSIFLYRDIKHFSEKG